MSTKITVPPTTRLKTPADEERRYAAVSEEIARLLDKAAADSGRGGMLGFGATWLATVRFDQNEQAHAAYYARAQILGALEWRIQQEAL